MMESGIADRWIRLIKNLNGKIDASYYFKNTDRIRVTTDLAVIKGNPNDPRPFFLSQNRNPSLVQCDKNIYATLKKSLIPNVRYAYADIELAMYEISDYCNIDINEIGRSVDIAIEEISSRIHLIPDMKTLFSQTEYGKDPYGHVVFKSFCSTCGRVLRSAVIVSVFDELMNGDSSTDCGIFHRIKDCVEMGVLPMVWEGEYRDGMIWGVQVGR